jgi:hypothetical protein
MSKPQPFLQGLRIVAGNAKVTGPGYTMHGDFFNAWPAKELEQRVRDCIRLIVKCGPGDRS